MNVGTAILSASMSAGSCRSMDGRNLNPCLASAGSWMANWTATPSVVPTASTRMASSLSTCDSGMYAKNDTMTTTLLSAGASDGRKYTRFALSRAVTMPPMP
jgi:hypothetical protein